MPSAPLAGLVVESLVHGWCTRQCDTRDAAMSAEEAAASPESREAEDGEQKHRDGEGEHPLQDDRVAGRRGGDAEISRQETACDSPDDTNHDVGHDALAV